ncbi:MAG: TonB-dependent receptor plug [Phenylobacterium sp.]|nr:TonB-dependent receptor plug [Phenylobacterium sp.]
MIPATDHATTARDPRAAGWAVGALAAALAGVAQPASAAAMRIFHLPSEPVERAVVRFGVQGAVSVGGLPAPGCSGPSRPTYGLMTAARALSKLLPAGCAVQALDAQSFRVLAAPRLAVRPPPAPPVAPPAGNPLDELVVTAERREEPLIGRAYALTVVSGEDLPRLGGKTFADLASQMVGVTVTNLGSGRNKILIRGLSDGSFTGHTQSTVGLYLDDVPITYSAPDPDLRLVDIERVEVLRGPQGTLYGSGSIGGIVRFVTVKPDPSAFAGSVTVEALATQHGAQGTGLDAVVNLPVLSGRGALRLAAYRDERPGYIDNTRLGLRDVNYGQRSGVRIAGVVELSPNWRLAAGYAHQSINTRDSQYAQGPGGRLTRDTQVREPHDNDFSQVNVSAIHTGEAAELKLSAAFIDHSPQSRYDATGAFGVTGPLAFDDARQVDLFVVDAVLSSTREGRLSWLAGLFSSQANETDHAVLSDPAGRAPDTTVYRRQDHLTEAAIYGEAAYDLTPRLKVTAGGRLFASRLSFEAEQFGLAPGLSKIKRHLRDSGGAPKLRVSYAWSPEVVLYAQVQEGYRAGGFNIPAAADGSSSAVFAAQFEPDHLRNYEIGGTVPLFKRTLRLRAAVFHADWTRLQTDQYLPSGLPMTVNIGNGSNTGVEVEAVWRPDDHLQVRGNLLVEDPSITRTSNAFPAAVDIGLPGVSSLLGSADVRYRWSAWRGWRAEASGQVAFIGHSFLTFDGAKASRMGDYGVGRLSFALESERLRVQVYMDNVTDERANTFSFGNPFSRTRVLQSTPLRPRTVGVSLNRRF